MVVLSKYWKLMILLPILIIMTNTSKVLMSNNTKNISIMKIISNLCQI